MTERTKTELKALINSQFPTNGRGQITAAELRSFLDDYTDIYYAGKDIDPHDYGAKGDAIGSIGSSSGVHDGQVTNGQFTASSYSFVSADIGKKLWFDGTTRTISSVSSGVATFTPAYSGSLSNQMWLCGTDDTAAIQAALDAARDMQGSDYAETSGSQNGLIRKGGSVRLRPGKAYVITNSQSDYNGGKLSALKVARRTSLLGGGGVGGKASLCFGGGSYGHMVSHTTPNGGASAYADFITIADITLYGFQEWNTNALDGIFFYVAFDGYDNVDPFNRVFGVHTFRMKRNGFYFRGRGELVVSDCLSMYSGNYGFHFENQADYRVVSCNAGGSTYNGFRIYSSAAGHFLNCKSFYNGSGGGTGQQNSANWSIDADQMRNGLTYFTDCEAQESRGSSWYIKSGLNTFTGCHAFDPGRAGLNSGTMPSVVAGFHLTGAHCRQNTFTNCYAGPSGVAIFNGATNWGSAGNAVHIDTITSTGVGPQKNRGDIWTFVDTVNSDGTLDHGTYYADGFGPVGGGGETQGANTTLRINGVALSNSAPTAPLSLTAAARDTAVLLSWTAPPIDGGSALTDYIIEYKLNASGTWLVFSDGTSTTTTATVTGLTNDQLYNFRIKARNAIGDSSYTSTVNATPYVSAPAAVSNLTGSSYPGGVVLFWSAPADNNSAITDYVVEYKLSSEPTVWTTFSDGTSATTGATVTGLTLTETYDFRVSAVNAIGTGPVSNTATATVPNVTMPTDITGLQLWLDAADGTTITSSATLVSQWNDKSGNTRHTTQSTDSLKPKTGTRTINSLNVLDFDGSNDFIKTANRIFGSASARTIIVLYNTDDAQSGSGVGRLVSERSGGGPVFGTRDTNQMTFLHDYNGVGNFLRRNTDDNYISTSQTIMGVVTWAGTTASSGIHIYKNGAPEATYSLSTDGTGSATIGTNNGLGIGGDPDGSTGTNFDGVIGEVLVYNKVLSATELNNLGLYFEVKWGITYDTI